MRSTRSRSRVEVISRLISVMRASSREVSATVRSLAASRVAFAIATPAAMVRRRRVSFSAIAKPPWVAKERVTRTTATVRSASTMGATATATSTSWGRGCSISSAGTAVARRCLREDGERNGLAAVADGAPAVQLAGARHPDGRALHRQDPASRGEGLSGDGASVVGCEEVERRVEQRVGRGGNRGGAERRRRRECVGIHASLQELRSR